MERDLQSDLNAGGSDQDGEVTNSDSGGRLTDGALSELLAANNVIKCSSFLETT